MTRRVRCLGLIGDVHCEHARLAASLAFFRQRGVDGICAVGDIVDGYGDPDRCVELLAEHDVTAVAGNHERWLLTGVMRELDDATSQNDLSLESRQWLSSLPRTRHLSTVLGSVLLCHGLGEDDMKGVRPEDYGYALETNDALSLLIQRGERLVINGHTHRRMVRTISGLTIINAGTLARGWGPCIGVLDLNEPSVSFYDVDEGGEIKVESNHSLPRLQTA